MTRTRRARPTRRAAAVALLLPLGLVAGCSKDQKAADPAQELAAAKKALDATSGVHLTLKTDHLPSGVNGILTAEGRATHDPAFQGDIRVATGGLTVDVKVIAVGGTVYAVLPFTTNYAVVDPADFGAPDPAGLMDPQTGLSTLLTAGKDVTQGKQERSGQLVLTTFDTTVPGSTVASVIPSAKRGASFDASFAVDDQHRLHSATLTGPFYPRGGDVTYTITFDDYGVNPTITAP